MWLCAARSLMTKLGGNLLVRPPLAQSTPANRLSLITITPFHPTSLNMDRREVPWRMFGVLVHGICVWGVGAG